jgi:carotenoid cleavage dioxygenase-like enzyme
MNKAFSNRSIIVTCIFLCVAPIVVASTKDLGFELLMSGTGGGEILREEIKVEGGIPLWLDGTLIQNGGGRFEWPNTLRRNLTNAGDGYAKLDVFQFSKGTVQYTSKYARTEWYNNSVKINDIAPSLSFGVPQPPRESDKLGLPNVLAPNDNLAVNIISMQNRILMISDQPGSIQFDQDTLEFGKHKSSMPGPANAFKDIPSIPLGMMGSFGSAHPLWTGSSLDSSGDAYGLLNVQRLSTMDHRQEEIRLFKVSAREQQVNGSKKNPWLTRRAIAKIKMEKGAFAPYMHSFFLVGEPSPTHAVLVQHSMNIAMATLIAGLGLKPISAGFDIDLSRPMIFHIINLTDGRVEKQIAVNMTDFASSATNNSMIVSHTVNGYYKKDGAKLLLVLDVIGYDFLFFERFSSDQINNKTERDFGKYSKRRAKTFRFILDVNAGKAVDIIELFPKSDWEFPIINEAYKGKKYCYVFGYEFRHGIYSNSATTKNGTGATGMANMAMIKYNVCGDLDPATGKREGQVFTRPYNYFSEPWFVPRPNSTKEDDGVVLVLALDGAVHKGVLYVLDAEKLNVLATLRLPVAVNLKTHGRWIWN